MGKDSNFSLWRSLSYDTVVISAYAFFILLCPPLVFLGKHLFAAEVLTFSWIALALWRGVAGKLDRPPNSLIGVWIGLVIAYFAGCFRGQLAFDIIPFNWLTSIEEQKFHWGREAVQLFRWAILFSTPWIFTQVHFRVQDDKAHLEASSPVDIYLRATRVFIFVSACLALLEHFVGLPLNLVYRFDRDPVWWHGRSYGTFASPLEASLVYGLGIVLALTRRCRFTCSSLSFLLVGGIASLAALSLTKGLTGAVAIAFTLAVYFYRQSSVFGRRLFLIIAPLVFFILISHLPSGYLALKVDSLRLRTASWQVWWKSLQDHPHILLFGIGFSKLYMDNSFLWLLVTGGLSLFIPIFFWLRELFRKFKPDYLYIFLFWTLSGMTLDSIGFWGVGRWMWLLLALIQLDEGKHKQSAKFIAVDVKTCGLA